MIELQHRTTPTLALSDFITKNPSLTPDDFASKSFHDVKIAVKADLNADQGGLCVYCEKKLEATAGQVEHIKPKGGKNARPDLCFNYTNFAHSCINNKTCGQKKGSYLLPIEPGINCNAEWVIATNGTIMPIDGLNQVRSLAVSKTLELLGLNMDSSLVDDRKKYFENTLEILKKTPNDLQQFLMHAPFRQILKTAI